VLFGRGNDRLSLAIWVPLTHLIWATISAWIVLQENLSETSAFHKAAEFMVAALTPAPRKLA